MAEVRPVAIESSEEFPSLAHPPIVEAVIEIRARAAAGWSDEFLRREMAAAAVYVATPVRRCPENE